MSNLKQKLLIYVTAVVAGILLLSSLAVIFPFYLFGFALIGGVVFFPLLYPIIHLMLRYYGTRITRNVIIAGFAANILIFVLFAAGLGLYSLGNPLAADFTSSFFYLLRRMTAALVSCLAASLSCLALSVNLINSALSRNHSFLQFSLSAFAAQAVGTVVYAVFFFLEFPVWQYVAILSLYTFLADAALILLFSAVSALSLNKLDQKLNEYQNNNQFYFEITKRIPGKLGRAGIIHTPHGDIHTPAFMTVGTRGEVRYLSMDDLKSISAQAMLSNGYHLRNISQEIADQGGLAKWSGWNGPTLTDSGGFQVMSLGSGCGKVVSMEKERNITNADPKDRLAHVTEKGVHFHDPFIDQDDFIGPKESMEIQCRIGADIHMAYDELTSLADSYEYNVEALARTERWAKRSIRYHKKHCDDLGYHQSLYGVLQGGRWEDLRRSTAKKLAKMNFDGYGLGGAFLKESLGEILRWCNEELPEDKPRHLLGLSHPDDILIGTEMGADTFDCVAPTREARHGRIYTHHGNISIKKFADSDELIEEGCDCPTCRAGWTRGQLRALLKSQDPKERELYFNLASMHNLRFIIRLTEEARAAILDGTFEQYKEDFLKAYYNK